MLGEDAQETRVSLVQVNRVFKRICVVTTVVFVFLWIFWLVAAGIMVYMLANAELSGQTVETSILTLLLHLGRGAITVVLYAILIGMFSDTARGESPFTMKQVKRLRLLSLVLVVYAVLGVFLSSWSAVLQMDGITVGTLSSDAYTNVIVPIDLAPVFAAAVLFAFSFVFKYGVLLQRLSDETL